MNSKVKDFNELSLHDQWEANGLINVFINRKINKSMILYTRCTVGTCNTIQ